MLFYIMGLRAPFSANPNDIFVDDDDDINNNNTKLKYALLRLERATKFATLLMIMGQSIVLILVSLFSNSRTSVSCCLLVLVAWVSILLQLIL